MITASTLQERFAIPDLVRFENDDNGLTFVRVSTPQATAQVYLHGAHVTHFQPVGAEPVLFMSRCSLFEANQPIRGGVPLIFPWFGPSQSDKTLPPHGLARLKEWRVESVQRGDDGSVLIELRLQLNAPEGGGAWPEAAELIYRVGIGEKLTLELEVRNRGAAEMRFEEALHTYFAVGDVQQISVNGLANVDYVDKVGEVQRRTQDALPLRITAETDRVYLHTQSPCTVDDPTMQRRIVVSKSGSDATVVWNPWVAKAEAMPDFGNDEWPHMICIETCNVADCAVTLTADQSHIMRAEIAIVPLSVSV